MHRIQTERNTTLDILKAVAVIMVIITHIPWQDAQRLQLGFPFHIDMAVPLFLLISGYVSALSWKRAGGSIPARLFSRPYLGKSAMRYGFPFLVIFLIQVSLNLYLGRYQGPLSQILRQIAVSFLTGGEGPGSYYVPILFQLVFFFPLLFCLIDRLGKKGLWAAFFINLAFELLKEPYAIGSATYRLLIFRYTFVLACGCYFALGNHFSAKTRCLFFLAGIAFIVATKYAGLPTHLFNSWTGTSALASLYIIPVFELLLTVRLPKWLSCLAVIGQASYNIFLVQMLYYAHFYTTLTVLEPVWANKGWALLVNPLVCVAAGIALTYLEKPLLNRLQRNRKE